MAGACSGAGTVAVDFTKMHGCGNDFVLIDGVSQSLPPTVTDPRFIRRIADRRTGVGFDQMMVCSARLEQSGTRSTTGSAAPAPQAEFTMDIFNADGSRAGMCGNGARCFAAFVKARGLTKATRFSAVVPAPLRPHTTDDEPPPPTRVVKFDTTRLDGGDDDTSRFVSVCLGRAAVVDATVVVPDAATTGWCCAPTAVVCVDVGNPHCVLILPNAQAVRNMDIAVVGSALGAPGVQGSWAGPGGCNVGFVAVEEAATSLRPGAMTLTLRVWERGCGETPSCGSGSCAAALAVIAQSGGTCLERSGALGVDVCMPGGTLIVTPQSDATPSAKLSCVVHLSGPTATVFRGTLDALCSFPEGSK
jgi:diaminopimelate epimerase